MTLQNSISDDADDAASDSAALDTVDQESEESSYDPQLIAELAYELWQKRGSPLGSPEIDWFQAQQELAQPSSDTLDTEELEEEPSAASTSAGR